MKYKILFFLFFHLLLSAKYYNATVNLNDGTVKNGLVELPEYPEDKNIKFKETESSKVEKLSIDLVKDFQIKINNQSINYIALKLANQNLILKIKPGYTKVWARVIKEDRLSIYAGYYSYNASTNTGGGGMLYLKRENEDFALLLHEFGNNGFSVCLNCFSNFKRIVKQYFEEICPKLIESLNKDDFNKKGVIYLLELYNNNCPK